ncbi:alpha/beta fold hydrolase [Variovorax sp. ZS18.2.2]|uniref:alpha/beta hydrolase n=1 Tax=Variovorax sp. ZS18.2.2 TaxID=2971255 RepID=UPI002150BDDF|nr:alpha/beta fold hydrolase [Variovorax sp. ZS18.2.2]MCR6480883.1 alpha/beta fold hydrolase [Variovorax sp. ZS18.2.2]
MSADDSLLQVARESSLGRQTNVPLLVLLHGFASYEQHLFRHEALFDPRFAVVAPRAPLRIGPGAHRWFYFERTPDGPIVSEDEETHSLKTLLAYLDALAVERAPSAMYILGHSQGGTMALSVLLSKPRLIQGLVNINGRALSRVVPSEDSRKALAGMKLLEYHGIDNPIVPLPMARATRDRLKKFGVEIDYRERPGIGHGFTAEILNESSEWLSGLLDRQEIAR